MTNEVHPIRHAVIHTFERQDTHDDGVIWVARLHPYNIYPVIFSGSTESAVIAAAETMRAEAIEKHETMSIARQKAGAASKARAAKRKMAKAAQVHE